MKIKPLPKSRDKYERFTCIKGWVGDGQIFLLKGDKVKLNNIEYDEKGKQYCNIEVIDGFAEGMELYMSAYQFVEHLEYTFVYNENSTTTINEK